MEMKQLSVQAVEDGEAIVNPERRFGLAVGIGVAANCQNKLLSWSTIRKTLSKHTPIAERLGAKHFIGGTFNPEYRNEDNLVSRSLLTIDIDKYTDGSILDLEEQLVMHIDVAFISYSTYNHTPDQPRVRIVVPLSRDISPNEYRQLSRMFCHQFNIIDVVDSVSFTPSQFMFLPTCPPGDQYVPFVLDMGDADLLDVDAWFGGEVDKGEGEGEGKGVDREGDGVDDLALEVTLTPLDISDDDVDSYLMLYPSEPLDYDEWLAVGASLHHQYRGDEVKGYRRWVNWSALSSKHNIKHMLLKWRSFGKLRSVRPRTFASVIRSIMDSGADLTTVGDGYGVHGDEVVVGAVDGDGNGAVRPAAVSRFQVLLDEAAEITDLQGYGLFKKKVSRINERVLGSDLRGMLATKVFDAFGRLAGISRADIKKAITPAKSGGVGVGEVVDGLGGVNGVGGLDDDEANGLTVGETAFVEDAPQWVRDWVYVESVCEFANTRLNYAVKREAFNAKYDRRSDCLAMDKNASTMALTVYHLPTVVDRMYWPLADQVFEYEGKRMLNSYVDDGVAPCDGVDGDPEGQRAIDLLLKHVAFTLSDPDEQTLLLDWLCHCVQHKGDRINWALLLQGSQGVGKSYFGNLLGLVMGTSVQSLDTASIAGRFTGWAHGSLVRVVEEVRIAGTSRYEVLDKLKPFITNQTVLVEEKGRDHRTVPNFTNYLLLTNHKDAIPLLKDDRRYCVLFTNIQNEEMLHDALGGAKGADAYFDELFEMTQKRADALSWFLHNRPISALFNAKGRAPKTSARQMMIDLAGNTDTLNLMDMLDYYKCDAINESLVDVTWLTMLCEADGVEMPKTRGLSGGLLELGYEPIANRRVKIGKTKKMHTVWCTPTFGSKNAVKAVRLFHKDD